MNRLKKYFRAIKREQREHRSSFIVYLILRLSVIGVMVLQIYNRNYEGFFLCVLTLLLMTIPSIVQVTFRIELPPALEIIILLFIYAAEIMGTIQKFYLIFPAWDTILHTLNGFLAAAIGFSLVDLLNHSRNLTFRLSPFFTVLVAFCFSMTVGVFWEFFEFGMDQLFHMDMQKDTVVHSISSVMLNPAGVNSAAHIYNITDVTVNGQDLGLGGYLDIGLIDTMEDLLVNFIGAIGFSLFGYPYARGREKSAPIGRLIPTQKEKDRDYLSDTSQEPGSGGNGEKRK